MMPKQEYIAHKLTLFTVLIIALLVVVIPAGFYLSSYRYMEGELNADARFIADNVSAVISRNPEMWQYEHIRLLEAISRAAVVHADLGVRVLRMDGTAVIEMDTPLGKPFMRKQLAIYDAGVPVGTVETSRSLVPLLRSTFAIGFIGLVIGWLFFYIIKILFLRSLLATEKALLASEMKFRNLVEEASLAIAIVNEAGEIEYINAKNVEIIGYTRNETPTLAVWWSCVYADPEERKKITASWDSLQHRVLRGEHVDMAERRIICKDGTTKDVELRFSRAGEKVLVIFNDVSERKQAEKALKQYAVELENSNKTLQESLANVKQLSGMLPICASCKKIRDDKGYWTQVEAYISRHTDTLFSHGICPDCEKKAYEDLDNLKRKTRNSENSSQDR